MRAKVTERLTYHSGGEHYRIEPGTDVEVVDAARRTDEQRSSCAWQKERHGVEAVPITGEAIPWGWATAPVSSLRFDVVVAPPASAAPQRRTPAEPVRPRQRRRAT